jgi:rubrerythrin
MKCMSGDTEKEILKILKEAIQREQAAWKLYSRGRDLSDKAELKVVFYLLAYE